MRIYLDHQAATPVLPEVQEAMLPFFREQFGNASSLHAEGFVARDAMNRAREQIGRFLGAEASDGITFTGNGTEAVNLGIKGAALAGQRRGKHVVFTASEHPAVVRSVRWLEKLGFSSTVVPVDSEGRIVFKALKAAIRPDTILLCVHHANHDIGTIQAVNRIGEFTSERGITLFVDAIASAGWLPINVQQFRADLLAISPQRFYGPKGVGVLYRHRATQIDALVSGGEQEDGRRAGTENVPAIVGAGVAAEIATDELERRAAHVRNLQSRTLEQLRQRVAYLKLNGPEPGPERHPANLNLSIEFAEGEALGLMLDVKGFAVATGSACVSKEQKVPPVLAAIGLAEQLAKGNVILSFGRDNTEVEVDHFCATFVDAVNRLREMSPEWEQFKQGRIESVLPAIGSTK